MIKKSYFSIICIITFVLLIPAQILSISNENYQNHKNKHGTENPPVDSSFQTTFSKTSYSVITNISSIGPFQMQSIVLTGSGFGMFPFLINDFSGDGANDTMYQPSSSSIKIQDQSNDSTFKWDSGFYNNTEEYDAMGITILSWNDSEIIIGGFGNSYTLNGGLSIGDNVTFFLYEGYNNVATLSTTVKPINTFPIMFQPSDPSYQPLAWGVILNNFFLSTNYFSTNPTFYVPSGSYSFLIKIPYNYFAFPLKNFVLVPEGGLKIDIYFNSSIETTQLLNNNTQISNYNFPLPNNIIPIFLAGFAILIIIIISVKVSVSSKRRLHDKLNNEKNDFILCVKCGTITFPEDKFCETCGAFIKH